MATTDRPQAAAADAESVATACRTAALVHLVARADGDALAAAGIIAGACDAIGTPYHVNVVRTRAELDDRRETTDPSATTLSIGAAAAAADADADAALAPDGPVSPTAFDAALALDAAPDPALALAGAVAGGETPTTVDGDVLERTGASRRPGIATPVIDPGDGLAHTTLAHAAFSGDAEAARAALADVDPPAELDDAAHRAIASLLAVESAGAAEATPRAATAIERALRPYALDGPFATLGGYADVLDAVARRAPGLGIALALGHDVRADALDAWRAHAQTAHAAVRTATAARYDGLQVVRADDGAPVETTARLVRDFRSPEPVALAVAGGEAGVAAVERPIGDALAAAAAAVGGSALDRGTAGYARFDPADADAFVDAFREAR